MERGAFQAMPATYSAINSTFSAIDDAANVFLFNYIRILQNSTVTLTAELRIETVEIFNILGQKVHEIQNPASQTLSIETENWNEGIYFVKVNNKENRRLIVVR